MSIRSRQRDYVHKKVKRKFYIYLAIFFIMLIVSLYDILAGYIYTLLAVAGWAVGMFLGYISGRASPMIWHEEEEVVIQKRDTKGIIILVVYIAFALSRKWIIGHWLIGDTLTAFCFCIIAGTRLGRIISLRKKIKTILHDRGIYRYTKPSEQ